MWDWYYSETLILAQSQAFWISMLHVGKPWEISAQEITRFRRGEGEQRDYSEY